MAVTYSTAAKTARLNAVVTTIDAGTPASTIEIGTTGFASTLVVINLANPSATVSGDVLTFDFDPDVSGTAAATGAAAEARIKDGDGNIVISGLTVGTSGADINLDSTSITTGQTVTLTTGTITHA
jgi:hypothetical protein